MKWNRFNRGGRAIRRKPGEMNKTEAAYCSHLEILYKSGEIAGYGFEKVTLKLADDTRYTPDFIVYQNDMTVEFHEVKGRTKDKKSGQYKPWCEGDAKIKIKVAASLYPFRFFIVFPLPEGRWESIDMTQDERKDHEPD